MAFARARVVAVIALAARAVAADPKPIVPPVVGASEVIRFALDEGFVDDGIGTDSRRIAYVVSNTADKSDLHVVTLASQQDAVVDVSNVTLHPVAVELIGERAFVVGAEPDGRQLAALVELGASGKAGRIVYRLAPATGIAVIAREGRARVAVHRAVSTATGTRHEVDLVAIDTGKVLAHGHALELDGNGSDKQLEFRVNHWADGMTRAFGTKGGEWDPKENQRSPDVEAAYDLITGKFGDRQPIRDLFEQHKRFQTLADAGGRLDFLRMTWDNSAVQLWRAGQAKALELDPALGNYDPKSLQGIVDTDGTAWFALQIDPVNPDAVARQKADPEYFDVFHTTAEGKAIRQARVLETGRHVRFGVIDRDRFWILEKSTGSDRGGKTLAVYRIGGG